MAYDNSSRAAGATRTRARVLAAARAAFLGEGYSHTTIKIVAQAAEVSPETVYKTFGSKAALLKSVYDVAMAGDDDPVPIADRPEFQAMRRAATPAAVAVAYAAYARLLGERAGPLMSIVLAARAGDPDLEAFATTVDGERLIGATMAVRDWQARGFLRAGLSEEFARDQLWMLISPAVLQMLTARGWSGDEYADWLAGTLTATLLRA